jgi:hypothetical protein
VTLHAFDDGSALRFYSLSAQIQQHRKAYYEILERTRKGTLDVTAWLAWFLDTLHGAVVDAHRALDRVLANPIFWQRWAGMPLNTRRSRCSTGCWMASRARSPAANGHRWPGVPRIRRCGTSTNFCP